MEGILDRLLGRRVLQGRLIVTRWLGLRALFGFQNERATAIKIDEFFEVSPMMCEATGRSNR